MTTRPLETPQTRWMTSTTIPRILFVPGTVFFGLSGVFFLLFHGLSWFLLSFLLIASGPRGFYGLFVPGGVFMGFGMGCLLFHGFSWFVLLSFLSICGVAWDLFLCRTASALSLWVVLLSHELSFLLLFFLAFLIFCFFAFLLFCFFAFLLLCFAFIC